MEDIESKMTEPERSTIEIAPLALSTSDATAATDLRHISARFEDKTVIQLAKETRKELSFDETPEQHEEVRALARKLFAEWDVTKDGVISVDEIMQSDINDEFAAALGRMLDYDNSGDIHAEDLANCLIVLKYGSLEAKVGLLLKFIDRTNDHQITFDEAEVYLKAAPYEICRKLGFINDRGVSKPLAYDDILLLFENSDRGEDAINLFCNQIVRILSSRNKTLLPMLASPQAACTACTSSKLISALRVATSIETSTIFLIALVLLQVALYVYNFNYYQTRGFPTSFCVAKGSGLNLRIFTIILFLTMARTTMGAMFKHKTLRPFLPMGFNIQAHSFCGFCCVLHAMIHMLGHIAYHTGHVDGGFAHAFQQSSLIRGASWNSKGSGDAITGYVLMVILLLMAVTALLRGYSSEAYKRFANTHFLYNVWLIFIFLHVPHLWPYFLSIALLMLAERGYDYFEKTTYSTLSASRPCNNGVTFLSIPRGGATSYPGSYYRIKIPALSQTEWHPFSLAGSVSSNHLTFFVASAGDWTRDLYRLVSDPEKRKNTAVQVQGPFNAPAYMASKKPMETNLLVASGIGITPFFSLMATKVTDEQNFEYDKDVYQSLFKEKLDQRGGSLSSIKAMQQWGLTPEWTTEDVKMLHVVWSIREVTELMFYLDYVYELVKHQHALQKSVVKVDVYLTGLGNKADITYLVSQTLFLLTLASKTSEYMTIHYGRPNLAEIVDKVQPDTVYYCGGAALKDSLNKICIQRNIPFHPEDFDAGTSIVRDSVKSAKEFFNRESKAAKVEKVLHRRMSRTLEGPPRSVQMAKKA